MRSEILAILRQAGEKYVSGADLARRLNVSRTAVWKHICSLKDDGYEIDSKSRNGYRIVNAPDLLLPEEIVPLLSTQSFGKKIRYGQLMGSTNDVAKKMAIEGSPEGTLVICEEQGSGRGRLSRGWYSPAAKGIWASLILRPPFLPQGAPKCTLLAAVAIAEAIKEQTGVKVGIKWPNDILYEGKKLVGILTEMNAEMDRINYVVVGFGINVSTKKEEFPSELENIATSLEQITKSHICRQQLLAAILAKFEQNYVKVCEQGFGEVMEKWQRYSITLGQKIKVIGIDEVFYGEACALDDFGALLVKTPQGIRRVLAGDVSVRSSDK